MSSSLFKKKLTFLVSKLSPKLFFSLAYCHNRGRWPNLQNPTDISEIAICRVLDGKVNKLSYLADKYEVREYVKTKGLENILTPLLGVYTKADEIDFTKLPDRFALKINFGAGMNIICTDKSKLNESEVKAQLQKWLDRPQTYSFSERHYNLIPHKIVCEEFIDDGHSGFPYDYKFMCVYGKPVCVLACCDRGSSGTTHYAPYDMEWNILPQYDKFNRRTPIEKPKNFEQMVEIAEILSENIDFVRIDLYSNGEEIWFGEITLTPAGCIFHGWTQQALNEIGTIYSKKKNKLCLIYNTAPRYRDAIFRAIDSEYDCDWYFGKTKTDIKEMDISLLQQVTYYKTWGDMRRWYWKRGILRLLFKKKYQIFFMLVESRSLTDYIFLGLARYLFPKKMVYIWTHGWYGKESMIESKLKLWMFHQVSGGIFLYGNYAKKLLIEKGIPENKLFVIHNSLHYDQQKVLRKSLTASNIYSSHFRNNYPVLLFIGRLTTVKRLDLLLDAVSILKRRSERYNIVFVGDGENRQYLESKVHELELSENMWFYGACYDERINAELIYNADLCVAPGNVGLTAIHSMMFGCPVVSHNDFKWQMPEFEAIKPGVTGDFFERNNVQSIADIISKWFFEKANKRQKVREDCFKEIDEFWNPYFQMKVIKEHLFL